jgi:hypothetical protein
MTLFMSDSEFYRSGPRAVVLMVALAAGRVNVIETTGLGMCRSRLTEEALI